MNIETYQTKKIDDHTFQFFSVGKLGIVNMLVSITPVSLEYSLYNLAFGKWDGGDTLNDIVELRNGDSDIILATVGMEALNFLQRNRKATVIATGSVSDSGLRVRTRKYQMGICANYEFLIHEHNIFGFKAEKNEAGHIDGEWPFWPGIWYPFERGINYDAFSLNLK